MIPNWYIDLPAESGGRCYLGRHAHLEQHLRDSGRLRTTEPADVLLVAVEHAPEGERARWLSEMRQELSPRLTVLQSVTYVSKAMAHVFRVVDPLHGPYRARWELECTVVQAQLADVVVCSSRYHLIGLTVAGVEPGKLIEVRPAPSMPDMLPTLATRERDRLVYGFAGQPCSRKRPALARRAAQAAGAEFRTAHDVPHAQMGAFYRGLDLLLVPSIGDAWGMVVSEAIGCGVPVVCTSTCGAAEEVIESGAGAVVIGDDENAFVDFVSAVPRWQLAAWRDRALNHRPRSLEDWARQLTQVVEGML